MYYPIHTEEVPVELVLGSMISAIEVANRVLCDKIAQHCYVARLTVTDYVPTDNAVDDLMEKLDKVGSSLVKMGDKMGEKIKEAIDQRGAPARRVR